MLASLGIAYTVYTLFKIQILQIMTLLQCTNRNRFIKKNPSDKIKYHLRFAKKQKNVYHFLSLHSILLLIEICLVSMLLFDFFTLFA